MVTDKKIPTFTGSSLTYFNADIKSYSDYFPGGMLVPGRHGNSGDYRYRFNGMELDNELKGEGNSYDYGARMYDPRIGRWFADDPLEMKYPSFSTYSFAGNSPIIVSDFDGRDLINLGNPREFAKFKALIEKNFDGLIKLERDANNKVIMSLTFDISSESEVITGVDKLFSLLDNDSYNMLFKTIYDKDDTSINLGAFRSNVQGGGFRGGEMNGTTQTIDMEDMLELDKAKAISTFSAVMHEIVEAYDDQVTNGSPKIKTSSEFYKIFKRSHNKALEFQAKLDGFDEVQNVVLPNDKVEPTAFFIASKEGADGNINYTATTLNVHNGNFYNIKNFEVDSVTKNEEGIITDVKLGNEIDE